MSGTNARTVVDQYAQLLQAALHCVTPAKLRRGISDHTGIEMLTLFEAPTVELRRRDSDTGERFEPVSLLVHHHYRVITEDSDPRQYRVVTAGYSYAIRNQQQREILTFHWHPGRRSHEQEPRLHVGSAILDSSASDIGKGFSSFHIPTGYILLARVVQLLLTEFQVIPNRQDWESTLVQLLADA